MGWKQTALNTQPRQLLQFPKPSKTLRGLKMSRGWALGFSSYFPPQLWKMKDVGDVLPRGNQMGGKCKVMHWGLFSVHPHIPQPFQSPWCSGTGTDAVPGQGTRVQFQLCLQDSWCASQLYQIPIISEKIKAALSKILFFGSFFASVPHLPSDFSLPFIPPLIHYSLLSSISSLHTHGEAPFCYPSLGSFFLFY